MYILMAAEYLTTIHQATKQGGKYPPLVYTKTVDSVELAP